MATYIYSLTVPAATAANTPAEATYTLPAGVLSNVTIFFPPGPQGEVGIRLLHNRSQFYPSRVGQWSAWDSGSMSSRVNLPLGSGETNIVIQGKSPNANFSHDITIKLDVDTSGAIPEYIEMSDGIDRVEFLLGGL